MGNVTNLFNTPKSVTILDELSYNGRTILGIKYDDKYALVFFNLEYPTNKNLSHMPYSTWGYTTFGVDGIESLEEMDKLTKMYMNDIFSNNIWWENEAR